MIATNPIERAERLNFPLIILFGLALFATLIPFADPITERDGLLIPIIALPIAAFALIVNLRTLISAVNALTRDLEPARWSLIALTTITTRRFVFGKWRAVVRQMWGWHVLAGILRIGLALALAQYIHANLVIENYELCSFPTQLRSDLCYSAMRAQMYPHPYLLINVWTIKTAYAVGLLALLGAGEVLLSAAVGLCATVILRSALGTALAVVLRTLCVVVGVSLYITLSIWIQSNASFENDLFMLGDGFANAAAHDLGDTNTILIELRNAFISLADGGIYVGIQVLRPYTPGYYHILRHGLIALMASGMCLIGALTGLALTGRRLQRRGMLPHHLWRHIFYDPPYWRHGAIRRAQTAFLQGRQTRRVTWRSVGLLALYAGLLALAFSPRWVFISDLRLDWLLVIVVVVFGTSFAVSLRTLVTAADSIGRERRTQTLDLLRLTGMEARRVIVSKWEAVFRYVLPAHLLTVPLKLGLAYGVTQYAFAAVLLPRELFGGFNFIGWNDSLTVYFPELSQAAYSALVLLLLTLVEAGFLTALGIAWAAVLKGNGTRHLSGALFSRVTLAALCALIMFGLGTITFSGELGFDYTIRTEFIESLQISLSTLIDGGVMLSSNFMHPFGYLLRAYRILRENVHVLMGMGLYLLLTAACLRVAIQRLDRE